MVITKEIVLVGPKKGKTIVLGNVQFVDGKATLKGTVENVEKRFRYLHRCWQVQYADQVEAEDGNVQDSSNPDENGAPQGDSGEGEQGSTQEGATDGNEPAGADVHNQDGQTDAPVTDQRLLDAVMKLDPENEEHWTKTGKPAMAAVEGFYGSADITRANIDAVAPNYSRDAAKEQAKG